MSAFEKYNKRGTRVFDVDLKDNIRCIDPVMKYCQGCKYGIINYSDDVENYHDTFGANFETHCIYGLEKQQPSEEELKQFDDWCKKRRNRKWGLRY